MFNRLVILIDIGAIAPDDVFAKDLVLEIDMRSEAVLVVQHSLANGALDFLLLSVLHLNVLLTSHHGLEDFVANPTPHPPVRKLDNLIR